MDFQSVLDEFKKAEKAEDVIPLVSNEDARKLIIAWAKTVIRRIKTVKLCPGDRNERWRWLWEQASWCEKDLIEISGIPESKFRRLFNLIKGNRLIYPDGAVSSHAEKYLKNLSMLANARLRSETMLALRRVQKED